MSAIVVTDPTKQEVNIPPELAVFPESGVLYPKLLRRIDRPERLRQLGLDDLVFRLSCQAERERRLGIGPDKMRRAAIWYLIAAKCSEGKSEVSQPAREALLDWVPDTPEIRTKTVGAVCVACGKKMRLKRDSKFTSCRDCRVTRNRQRAADKQAARTGHLPDGWKSCAACGEAFEPKRSDARYCSIPSCIRKRMAERQREARRAKNVHEASERQKLASSITGGLTAVTG